MVLVAYSDSEESDKDVAPKNTTKTDVKPTTIPSTNSTFSIDRSNPRKIRVNLSDTVATTSKDGDDIEEPVAKRPRVGGGMSGFNAMLPAPKRDAEIKQQANGGSKSVVRKVFSLRTGAEPAFSRESDAELKESFAELDTDFTNVDESSTLSIPQTNTTNAANSDVVPRPPQGNAFMFKPLSVARNSKKKKPVNGTAKPAANISSQSVKSQDLSRSSIQEPPPKKKINLFSAGTEDEKDSEVRQYLPIEEEDPDNEAELDIIDENSTYQVQEPITTAMNNSHSQSLSSIASDLNLSASDRRQLFGRNGGGGGGSGKAFSSSAINVINFNTDEEYLANEALRANGGAGDQFQHNPVRAIAPGKHSLKQLVSSAAGQKDALEESFASGRRNKREAGNKYGW